MERTAALVLHTASHSGPARNFASRFQGMGARLHVYAPRHGPAPDMFRDFAHIHVVPYGRVMTPRSLRSAGRAVLTLVRDVARFRKLFRDAGVDTVVCATTVTPAAALAARSLGLTSVIYCGELFEQGRLRSGRALASRGITAAVPRIADLVIGGSDLVAAQFSSDRRARVVRLYPPIERHRPTIEPAEARERFGLPSNAPVVVMVGSLSPGRGQDVAIAALSLLRDRGDQSPVLAIAGTPGDGPGDAEYAGGLPGLVERHGMKDAVYFLGPVADMPALLAAATVFVNPARCAEAFGRAAFEALALGVPAIVTQTGAQTELLRDGHSALVVPPDDPAALALAVTRLLDSPALAEQLVAGAGEPLAALDADLDRERFRKLLENT